MDASLGRAPRGARSIVTQRPMFATEAPPLTPVIPDGHIRAQTDVFESHYIKHIARGAFHTRLHEVLAIIGIQRNHCCRLQQEGLRLMHQGKALSRVCGFGP
jgi:hypothetical protein